MAPNHDILVGGTYLSQDYMVDVCFTMDYALEAWLAYALDFQRDPNQAYSISAICLLIVPMIVVGVINVRLVLYSCSILGIGLYG